MNLAVVDASFVLSFLLPDEDDEGVTGFFKDFIEEHTSALAPRILEFEVMNGLKSAMMRKRISSQDVLNLVRKFEDLSINILAIDVREVLTFSIQEKLSVYDASYAWLARSRGCELMTHDKKLAKVAKT